MSYLFAHNINMPDIVILWLTFICFVEMTILAIHIKQSFCILSQIWVCHWIPHIRKHIKAHFIHVSTLLSKKDMNIYEY